MRATTKYTSGCTPTNTPENTPVNTPVDTPTNTPVDTPVNTTTNTRHSATKHTIAQQSTKRCHTAQRNNQQSTNDAIDRLRGPTPPPLWPGKIHPSHQANPGERWNKPDWD